MRVRLRFKVPPAPDRIVPKQHLTGLAQCVTKDQKDKRVLAHLATFYPADILTARGGRTPIPVLIFEQPGVELADHIVLALLVLQRQDYPQPMISD